jgi:hypothetical protein
MDSETAHHDVAMKPITPDIVVEYKKTFPKFLEHQESNLAMLRKLPKGNGLLGTLVKKSVEAVLSVCGLGNVDLDQARNFLTRTFENEKAFHAAIEKLETDAANMDYLSKVFAQLPPDAARKRSRADLTIVMKQVKHARVPNPELMGDKAVVSDENFFPFAACQLFALHLLEHDGPARIEKPHDKKHHHLVAHNTHATSSAHK